MDVERAVRGNSRTSRHATLRASDECVSYCMLLTQAVAHRPVLSAYRRSTLQTGFDGL